MYLHTCTTICTNGCTSEF